MSSKTKIIIGIVVAVVVVGVAGVSFLGAAAPEAIIDVAEVATEDLNVAIAASGKVESGIRADVFPPTAGVLERVSVDDGDWVREGTVLAAMDKGPIEAQVKQAEAAVAAAEAQLAGVSKQEPSSAEISAARAGTDAAWSGYEAALSGAESAGAQAPSSADLAAAAAATNAARSGYEAAKAAHDFLEASIEASAAPAPDAIAELASLKVAMDQAYAAYLQAEAAEAQLRSFDVTSAQAQADSAVDQSYAAYLSARAQQQRLESTSLSAERAAAQASVDQARGALALAEKMLADATLTAPVDGRVLFNALGTPLADGQAPTAAPGVSVAPQTAPFTIVQMDGLSFVADVDEVDVSAIEVGDVGTIQLDALPDLSFESSIVNISPAATYTTTGGTVFPVSLGLEGTDENILIGMKGEVGIVVDSIPNVFTLPVEALFDEGGTAYVYLVVDNSLVRTEVEVGTVTETKVAILSGVEEGDTVALSGPFELVDGMTVAVSQ